jgi:phosphatidylglycerol:prolipoprotein diacylglycerol transferase
MHPVLFSLGSLTFYTYGFLLGLGFAAGVIVASKRAESRGLDPDSLFWFFVLLLVGGIAGGRMLHVALNTWYYQDWKSVIDTRQGGLSIHGVLAGGSLAAAVYSRVKKVSFSKITDVVAPGLILGQAIGRIGCFFSGCCYGVETSGAWGFLTRFAPGLRHPYQLYESAADFALFAALLLLSGKIAFNGGLFASYVFGYSGLRFLLEFLRDNDGYFAGLSYGQWGSLLGALIGTVMYFWFRSRAGSAATART